LIIKGHLGRTQAWKPWHMKGTTAGQSLVKVTLATFETSRDISSETVPDKDQGLRLKSSITTKVITLHFLLMGSATLPETDINPTDISLALLSVFI
jgi:hypothetical protein